MDPNRSVDLYLTEISIELLGNKIYDINGKRQNRILNLFKSTPEAETKNTIDSNDLLCSIGYDDDNQQLMIEDQMNYTLQEANNSSKVNKQIIDNLRLIKEDQEKLLKDCSEFYVKKLVERNKVISLLNRNREQCMKRFAKEKNNSKMFKVLYKYEKDKLVQSSLNVLRLIKYIINDEKNESKKSEMISFIHAMRSNSKRCVNVKKPYKKEKHN